LPTGKGEELEARKTLAEQKLNPYFEALVSLGLPNDITYIQLNNQDQDLSCYPISYPRILSDEEV